MVEIVVFVVLADVFGSNSPVKKRAMPNSADEAMQMVDVPDDLCKLKNVLSDLSVTPTPVIVTNVGSYII